MSTIITTVDEIDFKLPELPSMPVPDQVLMVEPTFYDVEYVINPHMKNYVGEVDKMQAKNEWQHLRDGFKELGLQVHQMKGEEGFPDMVFCANQSLPFIDQQGNRHVLMGIMHAEQRKGEVVFLEKFYKQLGYNIFYPDGKKVQSFEGMGDALWHYKRRLLWGAHGFRSSLEIYEQISEQFDIPVICIELKDDRFYHLDTCLCILNENTALIYSDAFTKEGLQLIHALFDTVIEVTSYEAENLLAANAVCPDGINVMIQQGCTDVNKKLRDAGFYVHEFSTYEFLKSGGSIFCMKMLLW